MEREYLVEGLIVIVVMLVLFVGFLTLFPEVRNNIQSFSADFLGMGFKMSVEDVKSTVKLMRDSIGLCSVSPGIGCMCDIDFDAIPEDYKIVVDNSQQSSQIVLLNDHDQVEATWDLAGKRLGVPVPIFDGSSWGEYCKFDSIVLVHDASVWRYRQSKIGSELVELVSTDEVSQYPLVKLSDGNFCFIDKQMVDFEGSASEKTAGSTAGLVKIGSLPFIEGILSDYYSGEEFYIKMSRCGVLSAR